LRQKEHFLPKVDLHVHSRLSKNFGFDREVIGRLQELGMRRGLDGFALTEHIHGHGFWDMHEQLQSMYRYHHGRYELDNGFPMFSGCEVTVGERIDFIVVGELAAIEKLDSVFGPRLSEGHFPPGLDFLAQARLLPLIVISAHPFRPGKETAKLPLEEVFAQVHAIEVNGRDYGSERRSAMLAHEHGRPVSGGSDAHYYLQVGIRSTVLPGGDVSLEAIERAFGQQTTRAHCKPYAESVVTLCKQIKNLAKRRQEAREVVA
jgi:predicted metal-dependent phosphoesterase TrpH